MRSFLALLLVAPGLAHAACDAEVAAGKTAEGDALVGAFKTAVKCDPKVAESSFDAFWAGKDADSVAAVALAAIDAKLYNPVWSMMDKIPSYDQRDIVAGKIGLACDKHAEVVPFVKGGYFALLDRQFAPWDDALVACPADEMTKWLEGLALKPPASAYDDKYSTIVTAYVKRTHGAALPVLERASIEAANHGGPFGMLIEKMVASIEPADIDQTTTPQDRVKLVDSLVKVANEVGPEQAALIADRLFTDGATEAAASLLPRVYPNRVLDDGRLLYGLAAVETCDKSVVLHWASVTEPAKRWSILDDVVVPAREFKPKTKCIPDASTPWDVITTGEPVATEAEIATWLDGVSKSWTAKGSTVVMKPEKAIILN